MIGPIFLLQGNGVIKPGGIEGLMESRPPQASDDSDLGSVLAALTDDDCREILEALTSPKSAQEISDECGIPLSTTYRKVNMLAESGLVDERIDIRRGSKHTKRYEPNFDRVNIALAEDRSLKISIEGEAEDPEERIGRAWGEIRQEI